MTDYKWEHYAVHEAGIARTYRLVKSSHHIMGYLKQGGKKRQGWHVHEYRIAEPVTRLPHTLTLNAAMNAAKLILLSLEESS